MKYCGYMSAFNYVLRDIRLYCDEETTKAMWQSVDTAVWEDNIFVTDEVRKEIEQKSVIATETVSEISDTATDTSLKINGVQDGSQSYGRMVDLLLDYHFG